MPPAPIADLGAVLDAFTESWERGDRPRAEGFLAGLPDEDSASLIYHEYCLAEASDLRPDPDEYLRRFPDHAEALSRLFQLHSAFSADDLASLAGPSGLPGVGDDVGPYRLVRKLGEGSFARVFLAEQVDLEDRLVVLKVSTRATAEPRLLARASHPHIVPVIRHASADDGTLHLVCMPYLGGATLGDALAARRDLGRRPRSGADLLADLDRASPLPALFDGACPPARTLVAGLSYPRAMAWIVARLAEALDHAHRRGVSHGDLKPSNILLTADGVPMLFDFNLAVDWREAAGGPEDGSDAGGTLAYMAPERLLALAGRAEARPTRPLDRHRADLYGLGLVLLEALAGRPPELPRDRRGGQAAMASALATLRVAAKGPPRGRWGRPIPPGLGAILARCLAPEPADRYALGRELAGDLDRWRASLPLAFADEPRCSGLRSWARRRRIPLISGAATLAIALGVGGVASSAIRGTLSDQAADKLAFLDAPRAEVFQFHTFGRWASAERGDPAENARLQLDRYDVLGAADWALRDDIHHLPDRERDETQAWIVEQIWRHASAIQGRPDSPDDWRSAAARLDRTLARFPLAALRATRLALAEKLQAPQPAADPGPAVAPPRWMDAYLMGVSVEADHARRALGHYLDALEARPDFFWADYRAAVVACRINDYPAAARHLGRCVARRPANPALHAQLAAILLKLGQSGVERAFDWHANEATTAGDALAECERALAIDPEFAEALATRALIRRSMGHLDDVRADIDRFSILTRGRGESRGLMLRFRSQFHYGPSYAMPTHREEKALLARALAIAPDDGDARAALATTLLVDNRPDEASAECDRILEKDPGHLKARHIRALAGHQAGRPDAIDEFARLVDHPRFEELLREDPTAIRAYHYVATDHLRHGRIARALEVARSALAHVDRLGLIRGSTSLVGESHYLIARVHASAPDARDRLPAIADHLGRAVAEDPKYRDGWLPRDSRFDAIRDLLRVRLVE